MAITAQSHSLLQDFRILTNLVLTDSSHRVKGIGTKIDKSQKFSSMLWLCAVIAARLHGRVPAWPYAKQRKNVELKIFILKYN